MASETQEATTIYPPITPAWTNLALKNEPDLGGDRCDSTSPGMIADERLSPGSASSSSSSSSSPSRMPLKKRKVHYHSTTDSNKQDINESPSSGSNNNIREDDDVDRPIYTSRGKMKQFRCKRCPYVAITKANFWNHARTHIRPDKLLACPRCPFVTEYKHHYKFHLLNHLNSKPFKCDKCDYSGVSKNMLDSHMKTHTSLRRFRCSECDFATKYFHQLKLHLGKYDHARGFMLSERAGEQPNAVVISRDTHRVATTTTSRRRKSWAKKEAQPLRRLADLVETCPAIATPTRWGYERTASDQVVPEVRQSHEQNAPVDYSRRCESPVDLSGLGASVPLDLSRTEATTTTMSEFVCADEGLSFDGDVRRQIQCLRAKFEVMQRHAWTLEQAYYSGA